MDATYDGIKAFEINASYNELSNVSDTLGENVEAAISTFMQSLSINMGVSGYNKNHMKDYVPAVLFTLYDGYYIYSPTRVVNEHNETEYKYMLKPYNYYTVRYKQDDRNDVIINYTLDNYIVVYGWIRGEYKIKSGYLISNDRSSFVEQEETIWEIVPWATTSENKRLAPDKKEVTSNSYIPNEDEYRRVTGNTSGRIEYLYPRNDVYYIEPSSAKKYYENAIEEQWIKDNLEWITPRLAMRNNEYLRKTYPEEGEFDSSTQIFKIDDDNDPEDSTSIFTQHKTNVIKYSIQDNLNQAITEYSQGSTASYDFKLPKLDVNEWDLVSSNICMLTFMQGVPMGTKYYNNYALVQSRTNSLYVSPDSLYFINDENGDGIADDGYYHKIDCPELSKTSGKVIGFSNFDFLLKKSDLKADDAYYRHNDLACYHCIVGSNYESYDWKNDTRLSRAYYTALAREKYRKYKVTDHLNNE